MNNNVLIGTAMLNYFWETERKDTIDILLPFLQYSILKTTNLNNLINKNNIQQYLCDEFGFDSIPIHVLDLMLKRLSPHFLRKNRNNYYYVVSFDGIVKKIEKNKTEYKEHTEKVSEKLKVYLKENYRIRELNDEQVLKSIVDFFVINGICLVKDTDELKLIKRKDDKLNYCIAKFILCEYHNKSTVFNYITDMVKGFFISQSINFQPDNTSLITANYKSLKCFLDTSLILNALGLKTEEQKIATKELISMLFEKKAKVYIFSHNLDEVHNIICAYKNSRIEPNNNNNSSLTLENFDLKNYKYSDVERYESQLESKIEELGIEIVDRPDFSEEYSFDEKELLDILKKNINYNNYSALDRDIDSIRSIYILRQCKYRRRIEECDYIFISSNLRLIYYTNNYFSHEINNNVPLLISDMNLSAISWLKSYNTNKEFPKDKLIENAISCTELSPSFLTVLFEKIEKIESEGGLSSEEAAIYRSDLYCKKEVFNAAQGDANSITNDLIIQIFSSFKKKLVSENNEKHLKERQEENKEKKKKAIQLLDDYEKKITKRLNIILKIIFGILLLVILLSIVFSYIIPVIQQEIKVFSIKTVFNTIYILVELLGIIDLFSGKVGFFKMISNRIKNWIVPKFVDKEREKINQIIH